MLEANQAYHRRHNCKHLIARSAWKSLSSSKASNFKFSASAAIETSCGGVAFLWTTLINSKNNGYSLLLKSERKVFVVSVESQGSKTSVIMKDLF